MENGKKFNWKKLLLNILKAIGIFFLNSAIVVWLVFNFYGDGEVQTPLGIVEYSYWDTLQLKYKILVYVFIILGLILSYIAIKYIFKTHREDKKEERKEKIEKEKTDAITKLVDKVIKKES